MEKLIHDFSFGLFFWQTIILIALILLLVKYAWKPIMDSITAREEGIKEAIASAENAKKEMQELKADNQKLLAKARSERDAMLKEAHEIKEKIIFEAKETAQKESDRIIKQTTETIDREKRMVMSELKDQIAVIALEIAEKLLKEELSNENSQIKLIEETLVDIKLN